MASRPSRLLLNPRAAIVALLAITALLQTGCSSVFFYPDKTTYITPDRLNLDYQDIYLDTADGETLHGWWLPALTDEPAKGTVYYLHGNAQNVSAHILNAAWLPEHQLCLGAAVCGGPRGLSAWLLHPWLLHAARSSCWGVGLLRV